jgi:pyruvate kinase
METNLNKNISNSKKPSSETNLKKVKIIATLGPASERKETIKELAVSGVDIFRINLSHAIKEDILERIKRIREVEKELGRPIAILGDLVGPKIRIGTVEPGVILENGQKLKIFSKQVYGSKEGFSVNFPQILKDIPVGAEVYIGDGEIKLLVTERVDDGLIAKVIVGGELRPRKGFSAHGISMRFPLTEKDEADIKMMVEAGADALAVSFVQSKKDIEIVKKLLPKKDPPMIVAKFETMAAVENAESILEVSDGLMIARGDLGFSVPLAKLPHIQKRLINLALEKAKPVITATQMLESMIKSYLPTRAEVTDVANAILDGTDSVMLSAETAIGNFPVETVRMMVSIIKEAQTKVLKPELPDTKLIADAVSSSAVRIANKVGAKLIIVFTQNGPTAQRVSRHRPNQIIIALSPNNSTIHRLCFSNGVFPQEMKVLRNFNQVLSQSRRIAQENDILRLKKGEPFVICAGAPFGISGTTNLVWVNKV